MFHITDKRDRVLSGFSNHEACWSDRFSDRLTFPHKHALQVAQELAARNPVMSIGVYQEEPQIAIAKIVADMTAIYKRHFPYTCGADGSYDPVSRTFIFMFRHSTNRIVNTVYITQNGRINFFPKDKQACFSMGCLKSWTGTHKYPVPFGDRPAIERCSEAMFDYVSAHRDEFEWLKARSVEVGL